MAPRTRSGRPRTGPVKAELGAHHEFPPGITEKVRLLEFRARGLVDTLFSGEYHSIFKGRGIEFSEVREYQVGDDVRTIDWNVTARRGRPYVKRYTEERELNVLLVVDLSASKAFGTGARSNYDVAVEVAAILALSATRNNDRVGLLLVTNKVELFVPPGSGRRHAQRLLLELLTFRPRERGTDLSVGLGFVSRAFTHRSIVFLISDFVLEVTAGFKSAMGRAARRHDLIPIRLADPTGDLLPPLGWTALLDPETGRQVVVDTGSRRVRKRFATRALEARAAVAALLRQLDLDFVDIDTREDYVRPLAAFFRRRERVER